MTKFEPELELNPLPKIPLPHGWSEVILLALLHVTTLARLAIMDSRRNNIVRYFSETPYSAILQKKNGTSYFFASP